jgi:Tfp pilus assembly protein PilO
VQLGRTEGLAFEWKYFLPKRTAYAAVISEVQRMATESGLKERDAVFTPEPIEGTSDLDLLNITASFEGPYDSLMKFLYATDRAPALLMLENLQAAPQQRGGQINTSIRFQAIIQSDATAIGAARIAGVQQ